MSKYNCLQGLVKEIIAFIIVCTGIPFLIRNTYARNKVSIVLYHDPKPSVLDNHLAFLSKRYQFIALDCLVEAILSKDWSNIPPKSLVIALDEGYSGNFDLLEIFKKYSVIPTIYICSQIVKSKRHFWWNIPGIEYGNLPQNQSHVKNLDLLMSSFRLETRKEYLESERQSINDDEIVEMNDFVDFQSHTRFHPILTICPDDECWKEIFQSKREVEEIIGRECKHFSYPGGYYTEREIGLVRKAGYKSARTIDVGWNKRDTDPYKLKTTGVADDASLILLAAQMSGITTYLGNFMNGSLKGEHPQIKI
jgi:peptidoglycan/xylan/chitin deacetylase (PgdA/CDA1 family)|tara:strand:- start:678 stop:1601 length:924 start_codon:yes stop_codon:yes gene_type:complete